MDRNLGADRIATSSTDALAYGTYYQWGRPTDGHELVSSNTTSTLASSTIAGHDLFIKTNSTPNDWLLTQDNTLWKTPVLVPPVFEFQPKQSGEQNAIHGIPTMPLGLFPQY